MVNVSDSVVVDLEPAAVFAAIADLTRYSEWLEVHVGWRSEVPEPGELAVGDELTSVVRINRTKVRFEWTVAVVDPTSALEFTGISGPKLFRVTARLRFTVVPEGVGSRVGLAIVLSGPPLSGPLGRMAAASVDDDVAQSLGRFAAVFSA
jgi:ribosome-associated toxin RatA of RatAB toxin-antitoxin module